MKYVLFAYDFPHTKTNDFILLMEKLGHRFDYILAAPKVQLNLPESKIRTSVKTKEYFHPKDLSEMFDIPYYVVHHNSEECLKIIKKNPASIRAYYALAKVYGLVKRPQEAVEALKKILEIEPEFYRAYVAMAQILKKTGLDELRNSYLEQGKKLVEKALKKNRDAGELYALLGVIYVKGS